MLAIWQKAVEQCDRSRNFALATIVSTKGACPRHVGSRLLILRDGALVGTIGGGSFEDQVRDVALRAIDTGQSHRAIFSFCGGGEGELGEMICGGEADVFVEYIASGDPIHQKIVRRLLEITKNKASAYLISEVPLSIGEWSPHSVNHALIDSMGSRIGGFPGCIQLIEALRGRDLLKSAQLTELGGWEYPVFLEWIKPAGTAYICGAGHVGLCVARLAAYVDFKVIMLDDRSEFASPQKLPEADKIIVLDSFKKAFANRSVGEDSYLVIVTRGHVHDGTVLKQALCTSAKYIGMIGSRRKIAIIFQAMLKEGFTEKDLQRVHAPIGLNIGGETPQEIAVSIIAEMIQVRSGRYVAQARDLYRIGA